MDSTSAAELNAELSSVCTVTVRLVRLLKPSTTRISSGISPYLPTSLLLPVSMTLVEAAVAVMA